MTVTGKNLRLIAEEVPNCDIMTSVASFKKSVKFCELRDEDTWKVKFVKEMVNLKQNALKLNTDEDEEFTHEELDDIINYIVTS